VAPGQTDPHQPGFDPGAVPFHRTPEMDQPQAPMINNGQPGVYPMPDQGQQGMNDQGMNPLAAALAGDGGQTPQLDQSAMLAMALAQPDFTPTPAPDFAIPDFGGGLFGGLFG
jgi:hypothetical protein